MNYTTIEQSKKLLKLGLNPETSDMYYFLDPTPVGNIYIPSLTFIEKHLKSGMPEYDKGDIPCWSLGALLEVMPKIKEFYYPSLYKAPFGVTACMYSTEEHDIFKIYTGEDFLEAAFNMVVYLLENGYIKKDKE